MLTCVELRPHNAVRNFISTASQFPVRMNAEKLESRNEKDCSTVRHMLHKVTHDRLWGTLAPPHPSVPEPPEAARSALVLVSRRLTALGAAAAQPMAFES